MTSLEWSFASEAEATRSKTYCRDKLGLHGEIQHFPQQAIQRSTIQFWMGQTTKITNSDLYVTSRNRTRSRRITGDPRVMEHPQLNAFYHIMPAFEEAATMADQSCLDPADRDDVYRSAIGACLSLQQQLTAISLPMPTSIPTPSRAFMVLAWIPCLLQSQRDICPTSPEFPRLFWSLRAILDVLPAFPSHPVTTAADVRPLNTLFQKATRLLAQRAFYVEWCLRYQEDTPFSLFPDNQDHRPGSDFIQSFLVDYAKNLIAAMNELLKSWDPPFRRTFLWELFLHSYLLLTLRFLPCAKSLLFEALCQELPKTSEFRAWQTDQTKPRISRQQHTHFKFWRQLPTHLGSIHTTNCSELEFRKILDELDEIFPGTLFTPLFRDELQSINFDTAPDSIITKSILNSHMIWNRQCWMDSSFFSDFISNCNEVCNTIRIDLLVFRENNRNFPRGSGRLTSSPRRRQGGQYSVSPLPSPRFSFSATILFDPSGDLPSNAQPQRLTQATQPRDQILKCRSEPHGISYDDAKTLLRKAYQGLRYEEKLKFVEEFVDPITQDLVQTCPTYAWLKDQTVGPGIYDKSSLLEWIETCRTKGYSTVQDPLKAGDLNTEYPCFQSPLLFRSFERCIRMLQRLQGTSKTHEDSLKDPDSRKRENQENQLDSSSNKHQRIETRASSTMKETKSP